MSYKSIMVHMDLGSTNAALLRAAAILTKQFAASAMGVAACTPVQVFAGDTYITGELIDQDRQLTERLIQAAERQFRAGLRDSAHELIWRPLDSFEPIARILGGQARCADLILVYPDGVKTEFDPGRRVNTGDLIMSAGRPVLIIPPDLETIDFSRVVVCWKDTREARRAIADALPLLARAEKVSLLQIAPEDSLGSARANLEDVRGWLRRHEIEADMIVRRAQGEHVAQIGEAIKEMTPGLIVAGAYGHSKVREWAFGGVTRNLLLKPTVPALLSH